MATRNRSALQTLYKAIAGIFADNTTGLISEGDMRDFSADVVESHFNLTDDAYTGAKAVKPGVTSIATLKAVVSQGITVGTHIAFRDTGSSDVLRVYELVSGTNAESSPTIIRPNDYAATTNEKVWKLAMPYVIDEDSFATDSASLPPSQQSTKAYVDAITASLTAPDIDRNFTESDDYIAGLDGSYITTGTITLDTSLTNTTEKAIGVLSIPTGTTTTGIGAVGRGSNNMLFYNGGWTITLKYRNALLAVSNGTDTYTAKYGFMDNPTTTGDGADGIFFRYTHSVNSGKWQAVCRSASVETTADTGITPTALTFNVFSIVVNSTSSSVAFYIDGSLVATITTNIPSTEVTIASKIEKSAGTSNRVIYQDWYSFNISRSTAR